MPYDLSYKTYTIPFRVPLYTAHGKWSEREGILIRLRSVSRQAGYGDVVPIPWFGTETAEESMASLRQLNLRDGQFVLPENRPATAFALSCAQAMIERGFGIPDIDRVKTRVHSAALLPPGPDAISHLHKSIESGFTTFKWKIGVFPQREELKTLKQITDAMPIEGKLRLDANGRLDQRKTHQLLSRLVNTTSQIDYLEQPMAPGNEQIMAALAREFNIPVALDESIRGSSSLTKMAVGKWPGPFVVKPSIFGALPLLIQKLKEQENRVILSSAFETAVGFQAILQLAAELATNECHGMGTHRFLDDSHLAQYANNPMLDPDRFSLNDYHKLWNKLG